MGRDRTPIRDVGSFDEQTPMFVEVTSPAWRSPEKINILDLVKQSSKYLEIDETTLKIKVPSLFKNSFQLEKFDNNNVSYYIPPKNNLEVTPLIATMDENFLYIWVEKQKKWKRIPLSSWELEED